MRLRDLEAEFLEYQHTHSFRRIELFSDADGIVVAILSIHLGASP